jgi:hypothetical protein
MSETVVDLASVPADVLVRRSLRQAIGFDPAFADERRIHRILAEATVAEAATVDLVGEPTDPVTAGITSEAFHSIDRARTVIASALGVLRDSDAPRGQISRLLVALHRLDVADDYRTLLLPDELEDRMRRARRLLKAIAAEIEPEHPETAFQIQIARSVLRCATSTFGDLLDKRDENCAARLSDVVGELDCVQVAVGSVHTYLDPIASDAGCPSVVWADGESDGVEFIDFIDLTDRSIARHVRLLDAAGSEGLLDVNKELRILRNIVRRDGTTREVELPGGGDVEDLQRSLEVLGLALRDAHAVAKEAVELCAGMGGITAEEAEEATPEEGELHATSDEGEPEAEVAEPRARSKKPSPKS